MITQKIIARTDSLKLDKIISRYGEDSMRQVVFIIVRPDPESEDLIPITIPEDAVGSFRILKPSGNFVIVPMSKSVLSSGETSFDVVLPASANTAKGGGYYDIRITSDTDKYYFTAQGDFLIDDNIISDEVLEDVSEVNGLVFPDDFLTTEDHVAIIDDDSISTDTTWSSDKISEEIEAHAGGDVSKTVSGNPITFTDGASAPLVKCVTQIQGSQDLHGYDKPWVGGAGKNKLPMTVSDIKSANTSGTWDDNTYTVNGTTTTVLVDSDNNVIGFHCVKSGSHTGTQYISFNLGTFTFANNTDYILNGCADSASASTYRLNVAGVGNYYGGDNTISGDGESHTIRIQYNSNSTTADIYIYPMIRLSTESDPTFAPYSNICPISGYSSVGVNVAGKNLFDKTTYTFTSEKYVSPSTGNIGTNSSYACTESYIPCSALAGQTITLNHIPGGNQPGMAFYDSSNDYISGGKGEAISVPSNAVYYRFTVPIEYASGNDVQIELGSTPTTYEPYAGNTYTIALGGTYYSGHIDAVKGVLVADKTGVDLGSLNWQYNSTAKTFYVLLPLSKHYTASQIANAISDHFNVVSNDTLINDITLDGSFSIHATANWFNIRWLQYDNATTFKTAVTGFYLVYELATPLEIPLTPTVISSLLGNNTMWTDGDNLEVEYITQDYQPLIDSIKQL